MMCAGSEVLVLVKKICVKMWTGVKMQGVCA